MASMTSMASCTAKPARVTGAATGARVVTGRPLAVPARLRARRSSVAAHASTTQFNKPGAVEVKEGKGGLPMVVLTDSAGAKADVYLFGGVCTSWVPAGGKDVLFVRPDAVFNKSKPISGGIPHCFPQFGPGAMQLHGFARNLDWALTSTTGGAAPSVELTLVDTAATREMWPTAFKATQTITLASGKLTATLTVTNTDTKPFSFTSSFHTYFAVSDLSAVAVEGLQGLKMLDRMAQPAAEGTAAGAVTIKGPVDSVYYKAPAQLMLKTGGGKAVAIKAGGWPDAVVWNPWTAMEACYKDFVCVENAAVGQPITVKPGASWSGSMELTAH